MVATGEHALEPCVLLYSLLSHSGSCSCGPIPGGLVVYSRLVVDMLRQEPLGGKSSEDHSVV